MTENDTDDEHLSRMLSDDRKQWDEGAINLAGYSASIYISQGIDTILSKVWRAMISRCCKQRKPGGHRTWFGKTNVVYHSVSGTNTNQRHQWTFCKWDYTQSLVSKITEEDTWEEVSAFWHLDIRSSICLQLVDGVTSLANDGSCGWWRH